MSNLLQEDAQTCLFLVVEENRAMSIEGGNNSQKAAIVFLQLQLTDKSVSTMRRV